MSRPSIIRSVSDNPMPYGINLFLYGDPGSGKTPVVASAPKTLILDADHGVESAASTVRSLGVSEVDVWPVTSWVDLDEAYDYLRHDAKHGYHWVWLDGISIGQDRLLAGIMENLIAPSSAGGEGKGHRKVWQADKGEYQQNMVRLSQWCQHMVAQPFNFGMTSHPWRFEDAVTGEEMILPWVQGKNMAPKISGMFNVIGYLKMGDDGKRRLYTKPQGNYYARDKFGALGAGMIDPSLPRLEAKIKAHLKGAASARPAVKKVATPVKKTTAQRAATGRK